MKKKVFIVLVLFILNASCRESGHYTPKNLRKLTKEETLESVKNRQPANLEMATYKNEEGEIISQDSIDQLNQLEDYTGDSYVNKAGEVVEIVIRKATEADKQFYKKLRQAALSAIDEGQEVKEIDIDCANRQSILQKVFDTDQGSRGEGKAIDRQADHKNLEIVVSLIEKCGMPILAEVSQEQMLAVWLVFQHTDNKYRKKYLPMLKEAANRGALDQIAIATMEDRVLALDGKPQIYGTQLRENKQTGEMDLYEIIDPEYVDKRRAEIGFEPLQEYLNRWNIRFDVPQKE